MSNAIERKLLSALLDKYERSNFFRNNEQPTRRIMLKLYDGGKNEFKDYDIDQSEKRIMINRAVKDLAKQQLLSYQWMKGEEEHILAKVWLNLDHLAEVYQFLNQKPKATAVDEVSAQISQMMGKVSSSWAKAYFQDVYETILRKRDFNSATLKNSKERADLFQVITELENMGSSEITERIFSMQCFGDSKKFEKTIKPRIISILKRYLDVDDDVQDEDLLRQVGIVKYPEQFEFCGNLCFSFEDGIVNYYSLRFGSSIFISDLLRCKLTIFPDVKRILTIENRANYIEYIRQYKAADEIVIYHGGQYSPSKKKFFLTISNAMPEYCIWEHWSDIDYGGFSMLARLRREIRPDISPYRMNVSELMQFSRFSAPITSSYSEKLTRLLLKSELLDCRECIEYMILNGMKLEQEAMLTETSS